MKHRAYIHRIAVLALLGGVAGCEDGGAPGQPTDASGGGPGDGGDAGDGGDGGSGDGGPDSGVTIEFHLLGPGGERVQPGDEGIVFPTFEIAALTMQLHRVELIGDTAKPGDLMQRSRVLDYPFSEPPRIAFPSAPPGIYSRLKYRVELTYSDEDPPPGFDDERLASRVRGQAFVTQGNLEFEYWEGKKVDIELDFNEVVDDDPGVIEVELDLAGWFAPLNWQMLADEDDEGEDDDSGPGGGDDDGEDDNSGPGGGHESDADIPIGEGGGHAQAAMLLREALRSSFRVPQ